MLDSSVYCNTQNIIRFYAFLVHISAFGFAFVSCLIVESVLCTVPLVQTTGSFLRILVKNYCIFFVFNFWKYPALISKLHHRSLFFSAPSSPPNPHTSFCSEIVGEAEGGGGGAGVSSTKFLKKLKGRTGVCVRTNRRTMKMGGSYLSPSKRVL